MPLSKEQAKSLYGPGSAAPAQKIHKFSNRALLYELTRQPLQMIAETFMRPTMAMKYHLLPALAHELAYARPGMAVPSSLAHSCELIRSVALLLQTADDRWSELPRSWTYLGSYFDGKNIEYAETREALDSIFACIHIECPMRFLERFCEPFPQMADWRRFFWLTEEEFQEFKDEKTRTIGMINADDEVSAI